MEVSASMLCAREMRGTPSSVSEITPFSASFLTMPWLAGEAGWMKVIRYWPARIKSISWVFRSVLNWGSFTFKISPERSYSDRTSLTSSAPACA